MNAIDMNDFARELKFEANRQERINEFYNFLGWETEKQEWSTPEGRVNQLLGIDKIVKPNGLRISEKFRRKDWGDLLIELCSKTPDVPGWAYTEESDILLVHTLQNIYLFDYQQIRDFVREELEPALGLYGNKYFYIDKPEEVGPFKIIKTHTDVGSAGWNTLSVAVPFSILEKSNIRYKIYETIRKEDNRRGYCLKLR